MNASEKIKNWYGHRRDITKTDPAGVTYTYCELFITETISTTPLKFKDVVVEKFVLKQELPNGKIIYF